MQYLIDKTAVLEQAITGYSALYVEGAAATGKTTAVQMLLKMHPKTVKRIFFMDQENIFMNVPGELKLLLTQESKAKSNAQRWFIFENMPSEMPEDLVQSLTAFVRGMPELWKAIFISREQPPESFLDLIWKRRMDIIPQRELSFSLEEVRQMTAQAASRLQAEELYRVTGGWAGCVDLMIRLAGNRDSRSGAERQSAAELRKKYEIDTYIQEEILATLSEQEQNVMELAAMCPWFNEDTCEDVCGTDTVCGIPEALERKGFLIRHEGKKSWSTAPLFLDSKDSFFRQTCEMASAVRNDISSETGNMTYGRALKEWYERHGFLKEALWICRQHFGENAYCDCLLRHYKKIPFLGISYTEILKYRDCSAQAAYLRGMCYRASGSFRKMSQEAAVIGPENPEIYLNLMFANPEVHLDEWLELAETLSKEHEQSECRGKFHLFEILGFSHTYLCGIRDLSGLFACTKKEENRKAHIWKKVFGEAEWRAYCLARINYYLETERGKALHEEDAQMLSQIVRPAFLQKIVSINRSWDYGVQERKEGIAGLYLYCLLQMMQPDEERRSKIIQLAEALRCTEDDVCVHNTEAVMGIFASELGNQENLSCRMLSDKSAGGLHYMREKVQWTFSNPELTCIEQVFRTREYLMQRQYGKAAGLLLKTIPHLKKYQMTFLYAEALFQQAAVNWYMEQHGQALQNVIESFLVNGSNRYVLFYAAYGNVGVEVLEAYIEWMQNNMPGGWNRKKKYNYGNVLRMPVEDYMDVVLRKAKRNAQKGRTAIHPKPEESLTMMENIVLQAICQGLSNAEISEQQNLKITTVKSHIYNIYKKLGVKSRMQAALKGKELGIV